MKNILTTVAFALAKPIRMRRLTKLRSIGLPQPIAHAAAFLIGEKPWPEITRVESTVERIRKDIAKREGRPLQIYYSPKPGSGGTEISSNVKFKPGAPLNFTMARVAKTGKNKTWGGVLYILARESKAGVILELGSCAGISGAYLASSEYCRAFHTIEGSADLAALARSSLNKLSDKATVYNGLFDDVLDILLPDLKDLDLAFIDGHHEKIATIHYWERLAPKMRDGGMVVFDDIRWSQDMHDGWKYLSKQPVFSHAADFGSIGVCIFSKNQRGGPRYWDLQAVVGKQKIGKPHGWSREQNELVG